MSDAARPASPVAGSHAQGRLRPTRSLRRPPFPETKTVSPLGALLPDLSPTEAPCAGAASACNLGASFAPSLALALEAAGGSTRVGDDIAVAATIRFAAVPPLRGRPADARDAGSFARTA